ncbi:enoyl-CoA delta isomerase 1, mitochondrial-like [Glandiceps talaboti]
MAALFQFQSLRSPGVRFVAGNLLSRSRRILLAEKCPHNTAFRAISSQVDRKLIDVCRDVEVPAVAVLRMNSPPVNSFSLEFLKEFNTVLHEIENDASYKGIVLTSAVPKLFSAGIDINEMYQSDEERLSEFWRSFQDYFISLYGSSLVTIAAINGHAIAGGCAITQLCDYRIITSSPNTKLKLNSTELGLPPPVWIMQTVKNNVGHRNCERIWQSARLFNPETAFQLGLVDELCDDEDVVGKAVEEMKKWLANSDMARKLTKSALKRDTLKILTPAMREREIQQTVKYLLSDSSQEVLGKYYASIREKK